MPDEKPTAGELQARQELANAEELGNDQSALGARKRLEALGAQVEQAAEKRSKADVKPDRTPQDRRAPGKQTS